MRNVKVKRGMAGSHCGVSRREKTEWLKLYSKKPRRAEGKRECLS